MKKIICLSITIITSIFLVPVHAAVLSQLRAFETTRLMSQAGTGVAGVYIEEASVLNPASIAFHQRSALYYQGARAEIEQPNSLRASNGPPFDASSKGQAIIISDTTTKVKGAASYQSQKESDAQRRRFTFTSATEVGPNSSIGITYRYNIEKRYISTILDEETYDQVVIGATHLVNKSISMGIVVIDPFKSNQEDGKAIAGFQYLIDQTIAFLIDIGANFNKEISDSALYRGALQLNFFADFYLRVGVFQDKFTQTKGNGWGMSWMGPKLDIEFAMKSTKQINELSTLLYKDESIKEASIAMAIRF